MTVARGSSVFGSGYFILRGLRPGTHAGSFERPTASNPAMRFNAKAIVAVLLVVVTDAP